MESRIRTDESPEVSLADSGPGPALRSQNGAIYQPAPRFFRRGIAHSAKRLWNGKILGIL